MTNNTKIPVWFWIVSVIALLWNIMGLNAFYSDMTISADALAAMDAAKRGLYETQPMWAKAAFGGAVILGTLGTIGLLLRQRWARTLLTLSVVCVLLQMAHGFMSGGYDIMGPSSLVMAGVILAFAVFLVWFAKLAHSRGYLK